MDRVEEIEKIFHPLSFLVVVHIQRNKGQAGQRLPEETETAYDSFFHRILIKDIKDNDQYDTPPVIVSLKKPAYKNSGSCRENRQERTDKAGFFHAPYSQKAEKQGEHYILIRKFQQTAVKGKIKGNL